MQLPFPAVGTIRTGEVDAPTSSDNCRACGCNWREGNHPSLGSDRMLTVTIEVAKAQLHELIEQIQPGEELTITEAGRPVAQLKKAAPASWPSKAGSYKKAEFWIAPDFDAPLDEFKEYME